MKYQETSLKLISFSHLYRIKRREHFHFALWMRSGKRGPFLTKGRPHVEVLPSGEATTPMEEDVKYSTEAYFFQKLNVNFYIPEFLFRKVFVTFNKLWLSLTSQRSYWNGLSHVKRLFKMSHHLDFILQLKASQEILRCKKITRIIYSRIGKVIKLRFVSNTRFYQRCGLFLTEMLHFLLYLKCQQIFEQ